jgi:DNA-binding transcriptional regulator YhcF (GntR family)
MDKSLPAVSMALKFLERIIKEKMFDERKILPSIRKLASMANVSLVTMWKAAQLLKKKGVVSVIHGQGIRLIDKENSTIKSVTPNNASYSSIITEEKWKLVKNLILRDIINGIYKPGDEMPSLKEMVFKYGTSFVTLKKSLFELYKDNWVLPSKRSFKISPLSNKKSHFYIVVLMRGNESLEINKWTPWGNEFLQTLNKICTQAQINLSYYIYMEKDSECVFINYKGEMFWHFPINEFILGFIVRSEGEDDLPIKCINKLIKLNKYIAVSDEGTCYPSPFPFATNPKVKLFSLETGPSAGRKVAQFLLSHGHKKIAFFSPFHQTYWSKARLEGIIQTYLLAGIKDGVKEYTINIPFPFGFRKPFSCDRRTITAIISNVLPEYKNTHSLQRIITNLNETFNKIIEQEELYLRMVPFFKKAILDSSVSTWICVNDVTAMAALDFLKNRSNLRNIVLVSYDDTFEAFNNKITSFNFNIPSLVNAMLLFILYPRRKWASPYSEKPVIIEGTIVDRTYNNYNIL